MEAVNELFRESLHISTNTIEKIITEITQGPQQGYSASIFSPFSAFFGDFSKPVSGFMALLNGQAGLEHLSFLGVRCSQSSVMNSGGLLSPIPIISSCGFYEVLLNEKEKFMINPGIMSDIQHACRLNENSYDGNVSIIHTGIPASNEKTSKVITVHYVFMLKGAPIVDSSSQKLAESIANDISQLCHKILI